MSWARAILQELFGLFVDDGWFAGVIAVWLFVAALALPRLPAPGGAIALFAGLAAILLGGATRFRRSRPPPRR